MVSSAGNGGQMGNATVCTCGHFFLDATNGHFTISMCYTSFAKGCILFSASFTGANLLSDLLKIHFWLPRDFKNNVIRHPSCISRKIRSLP